MGSELYLNGRVFTAGSRRWAEAVLVERGRIAYAGDAATARRLAPPRATEIDLGGVAVLPGFVDGHAHIVGTGEAAGQADLWGAATVEEIRRRIVAWADANPGAPRIVAQGWHHSSVPGGRPTRELLDAVTGERPAYIHAYDFHSMWLNTAALREVGLDAASVAPPGGAIDRDAAGEPTGYVDETAMQQLVWPRLDAFTTEAQRGENLAVALRGYRETGVTAATDMGLGDGDLAAMLRAEREGELTARITGHWRIDRTGDEEADVRQVRRAAELAAAHRSPWLRVTGIKVMIDGTVDGCTAALGRPYADGSTADPVWSLAALAPVVAAADAAGLQVAMHAIGDEAVRIGIDAVEHAIRVNGPRPRRHRIEHLEVVEEADIARLAALGITASMQPVHADPAIQENWRVKLGDARVERGFPWPEMTAAGARLAFGTDSPTSPYAPLRNMFVAATRRSAFDPALPANHERYALPLAEAIEHGTRDAAWTCRAEEEYGRIAAGLRADFVVLDRDIFSRPVEELLEARVTRTVVGGRDVLGAGS